ncbi:MAG: hypothetical protein ACR2OV_04435 [Hyphomicrobiaceae bacterium]
MRATEQDSASRQSSHTHGSTTSTDANQQSTSSSEASDGQKSDVRKVVLPFIYVCAIVLFTIGGMFAVWRTNQAFAPEMYHPDGPRRMAAALAQGKNFATFDLNINIREMRDAQIARFKKAPDVAILGASHWQEMHVDLLPQVDLYNAHVHRDYYEDMLAVTEMFHRHGKMPNKMIIAIRDRLFTPVADRTDFLWLPGIPYYRAMAKKLGVPAHPVWETLPVQRWKELLSFSMLATNVPRWYKADVKPHATTIDHHDTLDTLRPGGSIYWSRQHQALFTQERSARLAKEFAAENVNSPPKIDPKGLATLDRLLDFLKHEGVEVYFVHPPFNPIYYDRVVKGSYKKGLEKIEDLTRGFAKKYGFKVFGSFNPHDIGCTADMYIDAEHANPDCQHKLLQQFAKLITPAEKAADRPVIASPAQQPAEPADKSIVAPGSKLAGNATVQLPSKPSVDAEPRTEEDFARVAGVSLIDRSAADQTWRPLEKVEANAKPHGVAVRSMLATAVIDADAIKRRTDAEQVAVVAIAFRRLPLPVRKPERMIRSSATPTPVSGLPLPVRNPASAMSGCNLRDHGSGLRADIHGSLLKLAASHADRSSELRR